MKKKLLLTIMSSVFAIGMLAACGDIENDPMNDDIQGDMEFNDDM
ncbi:hypothetical protein ACERII_23100 [Evansella sp. AB-rgal1]